jgi:hypothetical protein
MSGQYTLERMPKKQRAKLELEEDAWRFRDNAIGTQMVIRRAVLAIRGVRKVTLAGDLVILPRIMVAVRLAWWSWLALGFYHRRVARIILQLLRQYGPARIDWRVLVR